MAERTYSGSALGRRWFLGLILGFASVLVVDVFGVRGLPFPILAMLGLAALARPRLIGVAGLVTGFGGLWTFLFSRIQLTCGADAFFPDPNCGAADLSAWIAGSAAILGAGLVMTVFALRRGR